MKEREGKIESKIKKVKLKSGATVYFLTNKKYTTSNIQIVFPLGWRSDKENFLGLAHLFEHLVGKRTKKFPGKSAFTKHLEENGIVSNAYTSPDITCYHQSQTHEKLVNSIELLYEAIYNTVFDGEDLEKEKKVVLTEAREYLDNDDAFLWHKMSTNLFPDTTISKFFFGNDETMANIDLQVFENFYEIYKNPKNANIFIGTNNLDQEKQILNFLNNFYKNNSQKAKNIFTNKKIDNSEIENKDIKDKVYNLTVEENLKKLIINKNDKTQSNLRLAYRIPILSKKERIVFSVLNRILTAGFSAKLMKRLRDEEGLIYGISLYQDFFANGFSYCAFATGCEKQNKEKVFNLIRDEIENLKINISQKDIDNVVPILEYQEERGINVNNDLGSFVDSIMYKQDFINSTEFLKLIKQVKTKDISNLINKLFKAENEITAVLE